MSDNVVSMPATTTFTPEQALASAASLEMTEVLIVGYDPAGQLVVRSSRMDRQNALWLLECAKRYIFGDPIE